MPKSAIVPSAQCLSLVTLRSVAENRIPSGLRPEAAKHVLGCRYCAHWISRFRAMKMEKGG